MFFRDLPEAPALHAALRQSRRMERLGHAHFFSERSSYGALPLALAFARYLVCTQPGEDDACGQCPSCTLMNSLGHPDVHWVYPMAGNEKERKSADWEGLWRTALRENPWMDLSDFLHRAELGNKQGLIGASEAERIQSIASLKSFSGAMRVVLMWMPDKMNASASNKLLKLLEEPEPGLVFLLAGGAVESVLPTVLSRCQIHVLGPVEDGILDRWLHKIDRYKPGLSQWAEGSPARALELYSGQFGNPEHAQVFAQWMRFCATRNLAEMHRTSEAMATWGREEVKAFLVQCTHWFRAALRASLFGSASPPPELNDSGLQWTRFVGFFDHVRTEALFVAIEKALHDIERNLYLKMVVFDLSLTMGELLRNSGGNK